MNQLFIENFSLNIIFSAAQDFIRGYSVEISLIFLSQNNQIQRSQRNIPFNNLNQLCKSKWFNLVFCVPHNNINNNNNEDDNENNKISREKKIDTGKYCLSKNSDWFFRLCVPFSGWKITAVSRSVVNGDAIRSTQCKCVSSWILMFPHKPKIYIIPIQCTLYICRESGYTVHIVSCISKFKIVNSSKIT